MIWLRSSFETSRLSIGTAIIILMLGQGAWGQIPGMPTVPGAGQGCGKRQGGRCRA